MSEHALTNHQIHMMRHALGLTAHGGRWQKEWAKTGETYRNHYSASTEDAPEWEALVAAGLAISNGASCASGDAVFSVSDAGKRWLKQATL